MKELFENDEKYKWLNRAEPAISSFDEKKQLRLSFDTPHEKCKKYQHSIHFNQYHSTVNEYFTMEELKYITDKIKLGLEEYLHYEIDNPIIYIETDEL